MSALACAKSQGEPSHLRQSAFSMWHRRWSGIIGIASQRALAASLLSHPEVYGAGENIPSLDEMLAENRYVLETDDTPTSLVTDVWTKSSPLDCALSLPEVSLWVKSLSTSPRVTLSARGQKKKKKKMSPTREPINSFQTHMGRPKNK